MPPDADEQAVAVFTALTDPTRRTLLDELARTGPATVTELALRLPISRQAIAKHLAQLADAGLIRPGETVGRRLPYRLDPTAVRAAQAWLATLANRWDDRLTALEHALDTDEGDTP
ncbi:ArsR/SmtB family transcription factor [Phytomonospora endophytica]|uniref:DNA-binding transcriptional ArsR family regulator n=1 Tax=Phytomonospora endophytica TaxID=714109 RepID=A0A841G0Y8_9ACTN|nr:metalloregulator ArsR/SmtB family transcription factor [Phytomonospora endophytica]MBB6037830.1 DNA-binding transcriptional ArsR family regulator [Phytomonospora endophytica]GIG68729.1 transcriptional regulator [Phytomonospora endophytica]